MTDNPKNAAATVQQQAGRVRSKTSMLVVCLGLILAVVVTFNVWLMSSQLRLSSDLSRERAFWALCHSGTTPQRRTDYFLQLVAEGNTEWQSAKLTHLELKAVDLTNAKLEAAVFSTCEFANADFSKAILNKAGLDNSDLTEASFSGVQMRNATLFKSVLKSADFRNADLLSTSFEQARAHDATFVAAKMGDCFLALTDATGADFTGADLSGANLEAAILKDTDLALTNLYGTQLKDTDFTNSNWWRSRGLSSQQLDDLTLSFPPNPQASESRQRDFEIWLTKRLGDIDNSPGRPPTE